MWNNSSSTTSNSCSLHFNYCFYLQVQDSKTLVRGVPAYLIGVINALFSLTAVIGNVLILAAIKRNSSLRSPSYIFLAGLVATDLGTGLITQPMYAAYIMVKFNPNVFPCSALTVYHTLDRYLSALTMETITFMAIEKWLHIGHRSLITVRRAYFIYAGLLLVPALFTGARIWLISVKIFRNVLEPVFRGILAGLCLLILTCFYLKVFKAIRHHQMKIHQRQSIERTTAHSSINLKKYKKSVYTILLILLVFLLSYLPSIIFLSITVFFHEVNQVFSIINHASFTLFYLSSSINPLLYCYRMKEIRYGVKLLVAKILRKIKVT